MRKENWEYSFVDARDILLDYCETERQAEKIKSMSETQLAESLFNNIESGWIPRDEMTLDLYRWMEFQLEKVG